MNDYGTQMHLVTFIFICVEIVMLLLQTCRYLWRPEDKHRGRYSLILLLLIFYDITRGLFPDAHMPLSIPLQHMISYGTGFLTAAYFPFYFYKEFDLRTLRWHATVGVPLFLLLPYLLFFVVLYALNGNFVEDARLGIVIPFVYAIVLLRAILLAIRKHYKENRDHHFYMEEITVYCAVFPWVAMGIFVWLQMGQVTELLCTNAGFVVITVLFFVKSAQRARMEHLNKLENKITFTVNNPELFLANCLHNGLTKTEILIVQKIARGMTTEEIAEATNSSKDTVKKHIQNIFRKTHVNSRTALLHKLQNSHH